MTSKFSWMRAPILLVALLLPGLAMAWWNDEWNFRKEIQFDLTPAGADIAASPVDVPVLLRLHVGNFGYFADVKPDGSDFRLIAGDDKTPLKYHVERFDPTNQMAFIWVRLPQLTGATNSDKIYLYYGNPKAPAGGPAGETYDANQTLALHFGEGDQALVDATAYANNATANFAATTPASLIGAGARLAAGQTFAVQSRPSLLLLPTQGMTLSAWIKADALAGDATVLSLADGNGALTLGLSGATPVATLARGGAAVASVKAASPIDAARWHHVALTIGAGRLALFVDGVEVASAAAQPFEIGGTLNVGGGAFAGEMDEVQASKVARPPEWIRAAARGQGPDALLVAYGNDAQREGEDVSYFKVTMQNLTVDAWVVIVILAVMFVISMMVMVSKALYLSRVKKANAQFLTEFENLRGDPTSLDQPEQGDGDRALEESPFMPQLGKDGEDRFRMSTLYRLYHHGVQEMNRRVALRGGGTATRLNPQAVDSLRAALDATQVRIGQTLAARMVLLTIAISGGPFLGLLGTVVGVMITFAAIAASGDVNVNSIAPGIAAALAATVAGLAVAIPALFGYNWLNTQIKDVNADNRVFIDEFVTRVAEYYS